MSSSVDSLVSNILEDLKKSNSLAADINIEEYKKKYASKISEDATENRIDEKKQDYIDKINEKIKDRYGNLYIKHPDIDENINSKKHEAKDEKSDTEKEQKECLEKKQETKSQSVNKRADDFARSVLNNVNINSGTPEHNELLALNNNTNNLNQVDNQIGNQFYQNNDTKNYEKSSKQNSTEEFINFYEVDKSLNRDEGENDGFVKNYNYLIKKVFRSFKVNFIRAGNIFRLKGSPIEIVFALVFLLIPILLANVFTLVSILIIILLFIISFFPKFLSKKILNPIAERLKSTTTKFWRKLKNSFKGGNIFKLLVQSPLFSVVMIGGLMYICIKGMMVPLNSLYDVSKILANIAERTFSLARNVLSIPAKIATKKFEKQKGIQQKQTAKNKEKEIQKSALVKNQLKEPTKRLGFLKSFLNKLFTSNIKERTLSAKDKSALVKKNAAKQIANVLRANAKDKMNLQAEIDKLKKQRQNEQIQVVSKREKLTDKTKLEQLHQNPTSRASVQNFSLKENRDIRDKLNNYNINLINDVKREQRDVQKTESIIKPPRVDIKAKGEIKIESKQEEQERREKNPSMETQKVESKLNDLLQKMSGFTETSTEKPGNSKTEQQSQREKEGSNDRVGGSSDRGGGVNRGGDENIHFARDSHSHNNNDNNISPATNNERPTHSGAPEKTAFDKVIEEHERSNARDEKNAEEKLANLGMNPEEIDKLTNYSQDREGQKTLEDGLGDYIIRAGGGNELSDDTKIKIAEGIGGTRDADENGDKHLAKMEEWKADNPGRENDPLAVAEASLSISRGLLSEQEEDLVQRYGQPSLVDVLKEKNVDPEAEDFSKIALGIAKERAERMAREDNEMTDKARQALEIRITKDLIERNEAWKQKRNEKEKVREAGGLGKHEKRLIDQRSNGQHSGGQTR
jgi:hypothetical protein